MRFILPPSNFEFIFVILVVNNEKNVFLTFNKKLISEY